MVNFLKKVVISGFASFLALIGGSSTAHEVKTESDFFTHVHECPPVGEVGNLIPPEGWWYEIDPNETGGDVLFFLLADAKIFPKKTVLSCLYSDEAKDKVPIRRTTAKIVTIISSDAESRIEDNSNWEQIWPRNAKHSYAAYVCSESRVGCGF